MISKRLDYIEECLSSLLMEVAEININLKDMKKEKKVKKNVKVSK